MNDYFILAVNMVGLLAKQKYCFITSALSLKMSATPSVWRPSLNCSISPNGDVIILCNNIQFMISDLSDKSHYPMFTILVLSLLASDNIDLS